MEIAFVQKFAFVLTADGLAGACAHSVAPLCFDADGFASSWFVGAVGHRSGWCDGDWSPVAVTAVTGSAHRSCARGSLRGARIGGAS
jgi:hypothetical protein